MSKYHHKKEGPAVNNETSGPLGATNDPQVSTNLRICLFRLSGGKIILSQDNHRTISVKLFNPIARRLRTNLQFPFQQ